MAKETLDEQQHRVYTLEVHGEKTLRGMLNALSAVASKSSTPTRSVDSILTALDAKINPSNVSKVVDSATGEPLVMYHGTSGNEGGDAFTYFDAYASNYGLAAQIWLAIPARNCGALAGLQKQSYMDALALLAVSPSSRCCGVPPGLGIALLDRGQLQHLRTCLLH